MTLEQFFQRLRLDIPLDDFELESLLSNQKLTTILRVIHFLFDSNLKAHEKIRKLEEKISKFQTKSKQPVKRTKQ